jgi:(p)ppGpp synthase/HD superfamily hydrolase
MARAAISYAELMHTGQQRDDGQPFIRHPLEVAGLLCDVGAPDHLIAAGVLHDLIEKTEATVPDLHQRFGPRITELVRSVSDDDRIRGYAARKAALRLQVGNAGDEALTLFAADKVSKLRELRRATTDGQGAHVLSDTIRARRLKHYRRSLALLEERLPQSPLVCQLRDELRSFLAERATLSRAG